MKRKYERMGTTHGRWILVVLFFLVGVLLLWGFLRAKQSPRLTVAIWSDPIILWSIEEASGQSILLTIPDDALIDAVGGFGTYEGASLWKLSGLEQKNRSLLSESLEETLGVPVPWYIGSRESETVSSGIQHSDSSLPVVKNFFSLSGLVKYLRGAYRTNISPIHFVRILQMAYRMNAGDTKIIDLDGSQALVRLSLPDGSVAKKVDVAGLDSLIGHEFEDERVRREKVAIGVYNTTGTPTLGSRFARKLSHMGAIVLLVDNSKRDVSFLCELGGNADALKSYTAERIQRDLGCVKSGDGDRIESGTDLEVFIGNGYRVRFESNNP